MSTVKYDSLDLQKLMAEVTAEFAKAEKAFSAKPKEESEKDEPKEEPKAEEAKEEQESDAPKEEGEKHESEEAPAEEAKEDDKSPQAAAPAEGDHGYDEEDLGHMHSMYSSMSPAELKAHHDAVRKCMDAHSAAAAPAEAPAQEMAKSEKDVVISEISLLKSELEAVKAKSAEEKKNLETALSNFLTKFVEKTAPAGKAITSLDIVAKSTASNDKPLQKSEIDAKLLAKAKDISLSKDDRNAINSYYFSKNVETVKHLL